MNKILIIGSFPAPYRVEIFKGLKQRYEADVFFVTSKDEKRNDRFFVGNDKFDYYILSDKKNRKIYWNKIINIRQYKCVIAYDWYLPDAIIAELIALLFGIPYVINCDGVIENSYKNFRFKDLIKRFFISNASRCFASGSAAEKYFLHYGADKEKIIRHNFTSISKYDILEQPISSKKKAEIKMKLGIKNKKVVLSVGQFIYRKGYDLLLEAWKSIDDGYQLIIIGGGPEKSKYDKIVESNKLKNVVFLDYMPHDSVLNYMMASDIFVLPTREDIWGLVINEAMAVWLPVITTNQCIAGKELLSEDAIIDVKRFTKEFPIVLGKMFSDEKNLKKMAEENHKKIMNYTYEQVIESHLCELEKL